MSQPRSLRPAAQLLSHRVHRRTLMKAGAIATALNALDMVRPLAWMPVRRSFAYASELPDIQFAIGGFLAPAQTINGVAFQFGPIHTVFVTARLRTAPSHSNQQTLETALATVEQYYPFRPNGIFAFVAYGRPYFDRLPRPLVQAVMPRLADDPTRFVLEDAQASPTDFPAAPKVNPDFQVPVRLESNDLLFTFRSDNTAFLQDVLQWLFNGSNRLAGHPIPSPGLRRLMTVTSSRAMFAQPGLPRKVAADNGLPFAQFVHAQSPMWMSFADQQVDGAGPPEICTFSGNESAQLTTAEPGDYFDNGAIQHLSHVLMDLQQFYGVDDNGNPLPAGQGQEPFSERVQYMFRSDPPPAAANPGDPFDGPAYLDNLFNPPDSAGVTDAEVNARDDKRMGHLAALQRSSRAADGTPMHMRMDGPGFDALDVPSGRKTAKLQFTIFVPTADFFATMRTNQASLDLVAKYQVPDDDAGLERFLSASRRQNFLCPPRRHRSFPLAEYV